MKHLFNINRHIPLCCELEPCRQLELVGNFSQGTQLWRQWMKCVLTMIIYFGLSHPGFRVHPGMLASSHLSTDL